VLLMSRSRTAKGAMIIPRPVCSDASFGRCVEIINGILRQIAAAGGTRGGQLVTRGGL
jgi:hypothetical protein